MSDASTEATELTHETPRELKRRIFTLAWPMVGEATLQMAMELVNTALIAGLGTAAMAGAGAALQVMQVMVSSLTALSVGASILVAHAIGANRPDRAGQIARQALAWALCLAVPLGIVGWLATPWIVGWFGLEPAAAASGVAYLRVAMGTVVVLIGLLICAGSLRGAGDSRTPMRATLIANVMNVVLAYCLIYGHLGLPALGVVGAAWATFLSRGTGMLLLLRALLQGRKGVTIRARDHWRPRWRTGREILGLGAPAAIEQILISGAWLAFSVLVAHISTTAMAVQRIAMVILSLAFLPGIGLSMATTTLVGQAVGARRPDIADRVIRITTWWALYLVGGLALVLAVAAPAIMRGFSQDPAVISMGVATLHVMLFTQPFWGTVMQQTSALRGMKDTISPLVIEGIVNWTAVAISAWLIFSRGADLPTAWWSYVLVGPVLIAATVWRRRRRVETLRRQMLG